MNFKIKGNEIFVCNQRLIFPGEVSKVLSVNDCLLVLLNIEGNKENQRNLYCVSSEGKILWRNQSYADSVLSPNNFVSNIYEKGGQAWAYFFDGSTAKISIENGTMDFEVGGRRW